MFNKRLVSFAVLLATGALFLTACGSESAAPTAAPPVVEQPADAGLALLAGTAKSGDAQPKTGDWATGPDGTANTAPQEVARKWVQLKSSEAGALAPVVVNGADLTLYRFDKDTAKPSKSTCAGDCAKTWPPVLVAPGSKIFLAGVKKSAVGTVKRDDGSLQVTIGGWPVYRFAKDTAPGDTKGQGVGGTWFGVAPNGQKAPESNESGEGPSRTPEPSEPSGSEPATSVVLFDAKNFSDNEASQGVAGNGCKNVGRPGVASSIVASGSLKIWSQKNCEGRSLVVDGDIADLGKVGFDNDIASVSLG
ncbi:hypothetical protein [Amycolatopsis thailandensis]|uniref:hypothetical protein n=1 Tax=Amycolatopsis thailandensis TaxID=589330 RepID=UPI003636F26F